MKWRYMNNEKTMPEYTFNFNPKINIIKINT